ncbi:HPP family protein [Kitasatospora sp. NPDC050543]|uniref:HPP family protein n=1 Tax=Kitasatospora sp. NPDC050543 TaxID=3364054 RepID=UPI0037B8677B
MLRDLLARLELPAVMARHDPSVVRAAYSAVNASVALAVMAVLAHVSHAPFLFPSLGATAFVIFYTPTARVASPRNTVCGHLIGVLAGYLALTLTGLRHTRPDVDDVTGPRIAAAAIALGVTCAVMALLGVANPAAASTALIVATGLLRTPAQLVTVLAAVVLLVAQGLLVNRLAGLDYPWWRAPPGAA